MAGAPGQAVVNAVTLPHSAGSATRSVASHQSVNNAQSAAYPARVLAESTFKGTGGRLAAMAHHHRTAGHPAPANPSQAAGSPARELIEPGQVDMLMRLLPSNGWPPGCSAVATAPC